MGFHVGIVLLYLKLCFVFSDLVEVFLFLRYSL